MRLKLASIVLRKKVGRDFMKRKKVGRDLKLPCGVRDSIGKKYGFRIIEDYLRLAQIL